MTGFSAAALSGAIEASPTAERLRSCSVRRKVTRREAQRLARRRRRLVRPRVFIPEFYPGALSVAERLDLSGR